MKQHLKLLITREAREVLGRRWVNLWILVLMLIGTFTSIAFSEGSMNYLKDKMEDPFTNWVSITKSSGDNQVTNEDFNAFRDSLYLPSNMERFDYHNVLMSQYTYYTMLGDSGRSDYLSARFFEQLNTPLIRKVLEQQNIIGECCIDTLQLRHDAMGFIITIGAARRLGYDEGHLPAYIYFNNHFEGIDSVPVKQVGDGYMAVPMPVLAIVKKLPNNAQMISGNFLFEQLRDGGQTAPFNFWFHRDDYLRQLAFFVADDVDQDAFKRDVLACVPDSFNNTQFFEADNDYRQMLPWKPGHIYQLTLGDAHTPYSVFQDVADRIEARYPDQSSVCRVFSLDTEDVSSPRSMFLSVEFNSLHHISEFETFAKDNKIQLELEQVHSKQNFDAVATMASILSAAMVIFSIICIIMFVVNMLQGYFQKVKRNIGTFKAFGMDGFSLTAAYILLLIAIVMAAVVLSLLITWGIEMLLPVIGVEKDGFNYLSLWNTTTYIAAGVILVSTVLTVIIVMTRLLSQTPGDLIYDRN